MSGPDFVAPKPGDYEPAMTRIVLTIYAQAAHAGAEAELERQHKPPPLPWDEMPPGMHHVYRAMAAAVLERYHAGVINKPHPN